MCNTNLKLMKLADELYKSALFFNKIMDGKNLVDDRGDFKVLKYNDSGNVEIQFINTGFEMSVLLTSIRNSSVKDPYVSSVFGVGVLGTKYLTTLMVLIQKSMIYGRIC